MPSRTAFPYIVTHSSIPHEQYETESGAEGAGAGRLRLHGIGRSIMFSLSINHIINKGKEGAWLSGRPTDDSCFLVEGRTCAQSSPNPMLSGLPGWQHLPFFGHSRISTEQLIRTIRYLSEKPVSLNQGTSLFPLNSPGQNSAELLKV